MPAPLVSVVIPAYNPASYLVEAIASARAQTHSDTEIILVDDGSDTPESAAILDRASHLVTTYIQQPNRGLGAARNAGFRAARGEYVVPLDADDRIEPAYVAECLAALGRSDEAFAYTDFQVFGTHSYREKPGEYNLYRLLDRNYLSYAALIRKCDWEIAGGYDEPMQGYEDWEFWLRLGARGRFGRYIPQPLFGYRKHGPSLYDAALARHRELVEYIRRQHPELYEYENRARIKARWSPAVSIVARQAPASETGALNQTIRDIQIIAPGEAPASRTVLSAVAFNSMDAPLDPQAAELAALAAWSGRGNHPDILSTLPGTSRLHRHLLNAELLALRSWTHHPARSLARLIPLRVKERVNKSAGRPIFDLSFYLQFQPNSVLLGDGVVEPLVYYPQPAHGRKRIALVTTHLGPGGAEAVLYDIASTLCSSQFETLLFATQSRDNRWLAKWRGRVDYVYDLAQVAGSDRMAGALCSAVANWRCDVLLLQNSLYGYAALPHIKKLLPQIQILDVIHYIDADWDQVGSTAEVASYVDLRVALAASVQDRLLALGTPQSKILLLRNGVDVERFQASPVNYSTSVKRILFAARLTPRKRPVLLADIARELSVLRPQRDFQFVIAGDGPQESRLRQRVHKLGCDGLFDFRGQVEDLAPLLAASELLLLPSRSEGVPLVVLEALASARPVVASNAGSIPEVLDSTCGILVQPPDASQFARAIHLLLDQPELREKMGVAGRRKIEANHDIRKTLAPLAAVLESGWEAHHGSSVSVSSTSRSTAME